MTEPFPMIAACTGMIKALSDLLPLAMKHDRNEAFSGEVINQLSRLGSVPGAGGSVPLKSRTGFKAAE